MSVHVLDDPVAGSHLARLRDRDTRPDRFRAHARQLGSMLARAAVAALPAHSGRVTTPLGSAATVEPPDGLVAVPVLRAGLGLLSGVLDVLPGANVGMVGLERDEETLNPRQYYRKMPELEDAAILLLEPMIATGGSASAAVAAVAGGASSVTVLSVVATQRGVERVVGDHPTCRIVLAAIDPELDDQGFIVPGLGDFGDRLFGTLD